MIQSGDRVIRAPVNDRAAVDALQIAVISAIKAYKAGYITSFDVFNEARANACNQRVIKLGKLTPAGREFLGP